MKYRKKPVVIEAVQWNGRLEDLVQAFGAEPLPIGLYPIPQITIQTLEGDMRCEIGDYIIKGIKGEFYPCKHDIFEATYEKVE
ncbi:TPA: hypothetical protein ACPSKZ_000696 [Legionella anisa]|uniref:hypothetical protein n=1 Tax=Legionella anisa TaxID=28082 RepID=UPI002243D270|nr:hypothetical protein [Legionella anisa]MCW8425606.1 hypothetical protein [Legionella anisa]MCW8448965.1 hypothetical protein [Legionella anisa]